MMHIEISETPPDYTRLTKGNWRTISFLNADASFNTASAINLN